MIWDRPLASFLAVLLPLIVLLHLLTRRRRTLKVPSLLIWERLLEEEKRSLFFRRLTMNSLLVLQLLVASFLILSLIGPRAQGRPWRSGTGPLVLLMDSSASMGAEGKEGRRFDLAVKQALAVIRRKAPGTEIMLMEAAGEPRSVLPFTDSRRTLFNAVNRLEVRDAVGEPAAALRAALALASGRPEARVLFITDGSFPAPKLGGERLDTIIVGSPEPNTAIVAFAVRSLSGGRREVLATVENLSESPAETRLSISVEGREIMTDDLVLPAGGRVSRVGVLEDTGRITAAISRGGALAVDDKAYAVNHPGGRIRVKLLTPGNWFLETVLRSYPNLNLFIDRGGKFEDGEGPWDVLVADRLYPSVDASEPLMLIFPQDASTLPIPLIPRGVVNEADPTSWDAEHPVTRNLDLSRVTVAQATVLSHPPDAEVLVRSGTIPLVLAGEQEGRRWVACAFDVLESSLPITPAFPILFFDGLSWLAPGDSDRAAALLHAGEDWRLPPEFRNLPWELSGPDGNVQEYPGRAAPYAENLDRAGFWTARSALGETSAGVSLLNTEESDLRRQWTPGASLEGQKGTSGGSGPSLTVVLLAVSLLLLLLEWWVQRREWRYNG